MYTLTQSKATSHLYQLHVTTIGEVLEFPEGTLRLSNSNSTSETMSGSLEVYRFGLWLSVCGEGFTEQAATVACSQLGLAKPLSYCTDSWLADINVHYTHTHVYFAY